jgi:phage terminase small subunit
MKAAKGNPGRRKLEGPEQGKTEQHPPQLQKVDAPEFLVHPRERELFRRIIDDYVLKRIARKPDLTAYARWAHYVHRWILCKETLEGKATWYKTQSNHGDMLRRHPMFKDQLDLERVLQSLEDRLGLNPVARQNIVRGLAAVPPAMTGLFDEAPEDNPPQGGGEKAPEVTTPVGLLVH